MRYILCYSERVNNSRLFKGEMFINISSDTETQIALPKEDIDIV